MSLKNCRLILGVVWLGLGLGKILGVIVGLVSGYPLSSGIMEMLAQKATIPFYANIVSQIFVPYASFFIFSAASIEVVSSFFVLQGGKKAKIGFLGFVFLMVMYLPFHQGVELLGGLISTAIYVWFLTKRSEENLLPRVPVLNRLNFRSSKLQELRDRVRI